MTHHIHTHTRAHTHTHIHAQTQAHSDSECFIKLHLSSQKTSAFATVQLISELRWRPFREMRTEGRRERAGDKSDRTDVERERRGIDGNKKNKS